MMILIYKENTDDVKLKPVRDALCKPKREKRKKE